MTNEEYREKMFIVDYYYHDKPDDIRTLMTKASSRVQAEKRCREMESSRKINIRRIKYVFIGE